MKVVPAFLVLLLLTAPASALECRAGHARFTVEVVRNAAYGGRDTQVSFNDERTGYWVTYWDIGSTGNPTVGFDSAGRSLAKVSRHGTPEDVRQATTSYFRKIGEAARNACRNLRQAASD